MSNELDESFRSLIISSLHVAAMKSPPLPTTEYIFQMYLALKEMVNEDEFVLNKVSKIPGVMLAAMDDDKDIHNYLEDHREEIIFLKDKFSSMEEVRVFLNSFHSEPTLVENARGRVRVFLKKYEDAGITDKLTVVIQFIEDNKSFVEACLSESGANSLDFKDVSDNIFMVPVSKLTELVNQLKNDELNRSKIFETKLDVGYGNSVWREYSYLLRNYSSWPLTMEGRTVWSVWILEFSQLKVTEKSSNNEGCFIATACYGSYDNPNVLILRNFRDTYLAKTVLGKMFIKTYYFFSPRLARFISKSNDRRAVTRFLLVEPIVKLLSKKYFK